MPLLGTHSSGGSGPSPVSKSLQDERRSLEEREGRTPGKESPFSLSLGSQPFHYSKTMPQMKIFRFVRKKACLYDDSFLSFRIHATRTRGGICSNFLN